MPDVDVEFEEEVTFNLASRDGIEAALHRVTEHMPGDRWLTDANRYYVQCQQLLDEDITADTVNGNDLAEYIALSGSGHCVDGWSCIGRAIHCFLRGDPYNAVHLAYYAELRAVLSILANEGIGVFDLKHFIVDESGFARKLDGPEIPTHRLAWDAFDWWTKQDEAIDLLKNVISPAGVCLGDWLDAFDRGETALKRFGKEWLTRWGMDVRTFNADKGSRNVASYWPSSVNPWSLPPAGHELMNLGEFWRPLEPDTSSRFDKLDKYFLRSILEKEYRGYTGRSPRSIRGGPGYATKIDDTLVNIGIGDANRGDWSEFLTGRVMPDELKLIASASTNSQIGLVGHEVEIISRAILLLRVATGATARHFNAVGLGQDELAFWVNTMGKDRGIWPEGEQPSPIVDLWQDVADALDEIPESAEFYEIEEMDRFDYLSRYHGQIAILEQHERIAIWGLIS